MKKRWLDGSALLCRLSALWITLLAVAAVLPAQETRGAIRGRVVDSSAAVVPNATVGATNIATNVTVSTQSNSDGNYEIPFLLPGTYRLTAQLAGFKTYRRDVQLRIGDRITVEIPMEVGELKDQVSVTAETPLLEAATASLGQVVDRQRIRDLPVAHGNWTACALTAARSPSTAQPT